LEPGWEVDGSRPGRFGLLFIGIWTVFLLQPLQAGWNLRDQPVGWIGMAAVVAFATWYLAVFAARRQDLRSGILTVRVGPAVAKVLVGLALAAVVCVTVGQPGTACAVYLSVLCTMTLPARIGVPAAVLNASGFFLLGIFVPGWDLDGGLLLGGLAATMAVWGIQMMMVRNAQLVAATSENQRLAVSEERNRFARDLHDILGHSLTVITVKAELANRLFDLDPERARAELADLEWLSRDALADVRRAVEGYRELTLPGELARARAALDAAQIEADLPNSTDDIPSERRELFAWAVREGVTNVIRHSGATRCRIRLNPAQVEVSDDGRGAGSPDAVGNGLIGLRERAEASGATVITRTLSPGFSLAVAVRDD
jgi:two-component system sensor histidine kinase DesK